ncbi:MAG: alpha/beta hydrolase [Verrucomicrobiota bacterium]
MSDTSWNNYRRLDFISKGRPAILVFPHHARPGNPWIWRTEFFDAFPQADIALLAEGFHLAYLDIQNLYGGPTAMEAMDHFYEQVIHDFKLSPKMILEGLSRGGLFAFNWSARQPGKVAGLYVDAPVCDFKSWPAGLGSGTGSPEDWERCKKVYGLSDFDALAYPGNPVDNLKPIAQAKIPIFAVCGDSDEVVPMEENIQVVEKRFLELGGKIELMIKPGCGHHPHSLEDPTPIVQFALSLFPIS